MAIVFTASNFFLGGSYDLTVSPQLILTNSSTYTETSTLVQVEAEEVSGSGYARANLTVKSNSQQPDGSYRLVYNLATFTASGGSIVFDRVALFADSQFIGYFNYGSTTIADGITKPFRSVTINRTDSGTLVNGSDGTPAQSNSTANFTQPAVSATVAVSLGNTAPFPVGSYCYFTDGTNVGWYKVTAIGSGTAMTIQNLGLNGGAAPGTAMGAGGDFVPSGIPGAGFTGGSYDAGTGVVTFTSDDELGFFTGDLRGAAGAAGTNGLGWTGGSYNAGTGIVTFASNDGLGFSTSDLRGANGVNGFGLRYTYSASTIAPPGAGEIIFNNASPGLATNIHLFDSDRNSADVSAVLLDLNPGSDILVFDESDASAWALFALTSVTDNTTYVTLAVTSIGAAGTFAGDVSLTFANKGDTGATGSTGSAGADGITGFGLRFTFSATTTGPAGAGELRFNNASPGSATNIFIDAEDRNALDVSGITSALNAGSSILVLDESDPAVWALFTLSSVTDNGTDLTLVVTAVGAAGTFAGNVSLTFANKGNTGATGATGGVSAATTLTFTETTEPSTPSVNDLVLYVDTADGLLKQKTDAGVVSTVGAGGGASITDIWLYGGF